VGCGLSLFIVFGAYPSELPKLLLSVIVELLIVRRFLCLWGGGGRERRLFHGRSLKMRTTKCSLHQVSLEIISLFGRSRITEKSPMTSTSYLIPT
jgi:hypothetical protein